MNSILSKKAKDLTGQTFGDLVAIRPHSKVRRGEWRWLFRCKCGNEVDHYPHSAKATGHCGCKTPSNRSIGNSTHGKSKTKAYQRWEAMMARCFNPKNASYKNYGTRGIKPCDAWISFENFHRDMGDPPEGMTLERIDNSKGYCKDNCTWATPKQQQRNRRVNRFVCGVVVAEAAEKFGIIETTIRSRLRRGWSEHDAVHAKKHTKKNKL